MKRWLFISYILLCINLYLSAQTINKETLITRINERAASIKTLESRFIQTKHISLLKDVMISEGVMYYAKSNKLRWEYLTPYTYCFILNDTKVLLASSTKKDVIDIKNNQMFQEIAKIMMNSITGKCLSGSSDFNVEIEHVSNKTNAILYPKKKTLKQLFSKIILHFNFDYTMIETVELFEKSGDKTEIKLTQPKLNHSINESVFILN